jgi:NAD(P)-dependent dehydrogenase (short-subunit alcohol dehydrogenase family)
MRNRTIIPRKAFRPDAFWSATQGFRCAAEADICVAVPCRWMQTAGKHENAANTMADTVPRGLLASSAAPVCCYPPFPPRRLKLGETGRIMRVDLIGVSLCLKHALAAMAKSGCRAIVNTAFVAGLQVRAGPLRGPAAPLIRSRVRPPSNIRHCGGDLGTRAEVESAAWRCSAKAVAGQASKFTVFGMERF